LEAVERDLYDHEGVGAAPHRPSVSVHRNGLDLDLAVGRFT